MKMRMNGLNSPRAIPAFGIVLAFATVGLTVWLDESPVAAKPLYHTSRKIPVHSRQSAPLSSPLLDQTPAQPQSPAQSAMESTAPVPAVSADEVDTEAAEKPVSYNEPPIAQQPVVKQSKPARHKEPRLPKDAHPVVKAPEPLLPQAPTTQPKAGERPTPRQKSERHQRVKVASEKPAKPKHSRTRQPKIARAKSQQGTVSMTVPAEASSEGQVAQPAEAVGQTRPARSHRAKKERSAPDVSQSKQVAARPEHGKTTPWFIFRKH